MRTDLVERCETDLDAFDVAVKQDVLLVLEVIVEVTFDQPELVRDVAHRQRGKLSVAHERREATQDLVTAVVDAGTHVPAQLAFRRVKYPFWRGRRW